MTRFSITRRQAIFLFIICTISSKLQALPTLLAYDAGKGLWFILLFGALIDAIFLTFTIIINKICPNLTMFDLLCKTFGKFTAKIINFAVIIYFLFTAIMPYDAVRNVFANNLFDSLPWHIFSIFLIFAVGYLVFSGLKTIGRSAELYFTIIVSSVVLLILFGIFTANWKNILPILDFDIDTSLKSYVSHALWFGDYMIFYCLMGQIDTRKSQLKFQDIGLYIILILIYVVAYMAFYSLYTVLAGSQTSLLASISSFALLHLSLGRLDWFLVILSQIASVISLSTYIYCISSSINEIFGKKHYGICVFVSILIIYLIEFMLYNEHLVNPVSYMNITGIVSIIIQTSIPVICLLASFVYKRKKTQKLEAA